MQSYWGAENGRRDLRVIANLYNLSGVQITNGGFSDFNFVISHRVNRTRKKPIQAIIDSNEAI